MLYLVDTITEDERYGIFSGSGGGAAECPLCIEFH